jgi:GAF domain-containing protein
MLLASIHDPDVLLETMARRIAEAIGCDVGAVFLVDESTRLFRFAAGAGPTESIAALRATEGKPAGFSLLLAGSEDDVVEFSDIRGDARLTTRPLASAVASALAVPLRRGDLLVGVLASPTRTARDASPPSGRARQGPRAPRGRRARDRAPGPVAGGRNA